MSCRWLNIFLIVATMSLSMAQSSNLQIGGCCGGDLLSMARTFVDILESQDQCSGVGHPRDCAELQASGTITSGVYPIYPDGAGDPFFVWCDMETDGGGWTVFQRRKDGSVDFQLDWASFKYGFGSVSAEHWLGNDNINRISTQKATYELRVDLEDFEGQTRHASYSTFSVANEAANYHISLGSYSGDAGDSLSYQNHQEFTTRDRDNDQVLGANCAVQYSAWWHNECHHSNLNGLYLHGETTEYATGVVWRDWLGYYYSLKKTELKMRPV